MKSSRPGGTVEAARSPRLPCPRMRRFGRPRWCWRRHISIMTQPIAGGGTATSERSASAAICSTTGPSIGCGSGSPYVGGGHSATCSPVSTRPAEIRSATTPWVSVLADGRDPPWAHTRRTASPKSPPSLPGSPGQSRVRLHPPALPVSARTAPTARCHVIIMDEAAEPGTAEAPTSENANRSAQLACVDNHPRKRPCPALVSSFRSRSRQRRLVIREPQVTRLRLDSIIRLRSVRDQIRPFHMNSVDFAPVRMLLNDCIPYHTIPCPSECHASIPLAAI